MLEYSGLLGGLVACSYRDLSEWHRAMQAKGSKIEAKAQCWPIEQ